jgi:signal transduction histidine kinase
MKVRAWFSVVSLVFTFLVEHGGAQPAHLWRGYKTSDGLVQNACTSVTIGSGGSVMVRHAAEASSFSLLDGYEIKSIPVPPSKSRVFESYGGQLWATVEVGLAEFRNGAWLTHPVSEIETHFAANPSADIPLLPVMHGRVLVLLPDRLLRVDLEEAARPHITQLKLSADTRLESFTGMNAALDGGLWISGINGFAKVEGPLRNVKPDSIWVEFIPPEDLGLRSFRKVRANAQGTISTQGKANGRMGLVTIERQEWSVLLLDEPEIQFAWRCGDHAWAATPDALYRMADGGGGLRIVDEISIRRVMDVAVEEDGSFWVATSDGLYRRAPALWTPARTDEIFKRAKDRTAPTERAANIQRLIRTGAGAEDLAPSQAHAQATDDESIAATDWNTFLVAKNGDLWLGGMSQIAWRHANKWRIFASTNQVGPEEVLSFAESPEGRIWCATPGKVWQFDGQNWLTLLGGFDRINALHCSARGTLWVATDNGLHRFQRGAWLSNGPEDGLPSQIVNAVYEDDQGDFRVETPAGLSRFTPEADRDPPRTWLRSGAGEKREFREGASATFYADGRDKWNLTVPERLLFSYRLNEREWTAFQENREFSFVDLPLGRHILQVRAMDRNGNVDPKPARYEFAIVVPWYRETRLVLVLSCALAIAVFFAAVAMNRHHRLQLSYAAVERTIAQRTHELELANRELLQSQKMRALGTLSAGIAHDFNNILSIIRGSVQMIEENTGNVEKVRTRLDRIKTVVQQGAGIVEAMLGFSRSSEHESGPCDLEPVVRDTIKLLGDRFLHEVDIRVEEPGEAVKAVVARDFLQQILLNFIFNAAEAMSGRKEIVISIGRIPKPGPDTILPPAPAPAYAVVAVRDSGSGIAPEHVPRIFEPFFTTKAMSARRGTGLGLSMVYELARKMGAGLAVETKVGVGSKFTLILPMEET